MTRKDYKAIADAIARATNPDLSVDYARLVRLIGNVFEADSDHFDRERFERACLPE